MAHVLQSSLFICEINFEPYTYVDLPIENVDLIFKQI